MLGIGGAQKLYETRGGPCPVCGLYVTSGTERCPHCDHVFIEADINAIREQADKQFRKSASCGLIVFASLLAVLSYLFSGG